MTQKIYVVVDYEEGFYEQDRDYARLRAVSTNLPQLYASLMKSPPSGYLLAIDEAVFNKELYLTISHDIDSQDGVENMGLFNDSLQHYLKTIIK